MERILISLFAVVALALSIGAVVVEADSPGGAHPRRWMGALQAVVGGTVVSASGDSFVADAYVLTPGDGYGGSTPATTQVTITAGSGTHIAINGTSETSFTNLTSGETFYAFFDGSPSQGLTALLASPPGAVFAFTTPTPKAFVAGTITGVDAGANTFTADAYLLPAMFWRHARGWHPQPVHGQHGDGYAQAGRATRVAGAARARAARATRAARAA